MPQLTGLTFVVLALACFRLTHLIVVDEITGPLRGMFTTTVHEVDAAGRMVKLAYPKPPLWRAFLGVLFGCPWCMGVWVSFFLVAGWFYFPMIFFPIALILAVAGGGIIVEMVTTYWARNSFSPTPAQLERLHTTRRMFEGKHD